MQQVHETFLLVLIPLLYSQQPCGCAPEAGHKDGRGARGAAGRLESKLTVVQSAVVKRVQAAHRGECAPLGWAARDGLAEEAPNWVLEGFTTQVFFNFFK